MPGDVSDLTRTIRPVGDSIQRVDPELGPNEKAVDVRRFFDGRGKSFQSHPVIWAHPDHFHRDPGRANLTDYRQRDIYKGLLAFHP
jgi:hypothetical protein